MFKKGLAALVCLATMSALWSWAATTWQLQTKLNNAGGTIKVRDKATQTTTGNTVFNNFTTSAPVPVTVTANAGYKISGLTRSGVAVPLANYTSSYSTNFLKSAGSVQSLVASFIAQQITVTGVASGPGSVSPATSTVIPGGSVVLNATPSSSTSYLTGVVGSGVVTDTVGQPVTFPYPGTVNITLTNLNSSQTVTASFVNFTVDAGASQRVMIDRQVVLSGSISGGGTPSWSQVGGPAVSLSGATTLNPVFVPVVTGTYDFQLTQTYNGVTVGTAITEVVVVNSLTDSMRTSCMGCHGSGGSYPKPLAFARWSTSTHKTVGVSCVTCHTTGAMPTPVNTATVDVTTFKNLAANAWPVETYYCVNCHTQPVGTEYDGSLHKARGVLCTACHVNGPHAPEVATTVCGGCHFDTTGNVPLHPVDIGSSVCVACHNPHSGYAALTGSMGVAHYNNITSGMYPASYVTSRAGCTNCHDGSTQNQVTRKQWANSGHAAINDLPWIKKDFKTLSGCVQCHTTTGFLAYSTGQVTAAWGTSDDKTKEVLTCIGCHSDISGGVVRNIAPVAPYSGDNYRNHNLGISNICVGCHSGTNSSAAITQLIGSADFTNLPFIAPHHLTAGANLQGKAGYRFPGQSYAAYSSNSHAAVGMDNRALTGFKGPCVGCHMATTEKHLYMTVTHDTVGTVTGITSTVCVNCHNTSLSVAQINLDKTAFLNALAVLKAQLAAKGFVYTGTSPYFNNTNWGSGEAGANTMGAAYNYVLMLSETGAYAHNLQFSKQLVLDSIDYLDNGYFDDSVETLAVPSLLASGAITQEVADSFSAFKTRKDLCNSCHGGTPNLPNPIASNAHPMHMNAIYGPSNYLGSSVTACQACHPANAALHMNGVVDQVVGATSACQGCHAGRAPAWNSTARIDCTVCHAASPAKLSNGVAAPYKENFGTTGHGLYTASNQCTDCHDANSSHISGSLGDTMRLKVANDSNLCASCHSTNLVQDAFRNMSTHVTKGGRSLNCQECHDPHGTGNVSMIRSKINGTTISFTDKINSFIDPVTNRGLCQVCHTLTNHFVAGVPETNHYSSGCLNCHTHNGGFKPLGGACDSCHGYPPAPKNVAQSFGTTGFWAAARYEDYSGGGGAHLVASHVNPGAVASQGWANCTGCHNGGSTASTPYHKMSTPVSSNIDKVTVLVDPKLRFSNGFTIYTGAKLLNRPSQNQTGSCFNISCHMTESPRWSTER